MSSLRTKFFILFRLFESEPQRQIDSVFLLVLIGIKLDYTRGLISTFSTLRAGKRDGGLQVTAQAC